MRSRARGQTPLELSPTSDALARSSAFTCTYPPLDRALARRARTEGRRSRINPGRLGRALRRAGAQASVGEESFVLRLDNGAVRAPFGRSLLSLAPWTVDEPRHAALLLDDSVVMHELGHALHYGLWSTTRRRTGRLSASVNEAVADLLSAPLRRQNPCHGVVLDGAGDPVDAAERCRGTRRISRALRTEERGTHDTEQVLRDFFWIQRGQPRRRARPARRHRRGRRSSRTIDAEPLALAPVFDDEMLGVGFRIRREWEASFALAKGACQTAHSVCDTLTERLGASRRDEMERHDRQLADGDR